MELRHLRYFLAVADELSFTKAAQKLHISQPPLSRQIKQLEHEIKAQLFDRNNKRVKLTDAGIYFEKEVRSIIKSLDTAATKAAKISSSESGDFNIAYISSTFSGDISLLLHQLSEEYPLVNFRICEIPTTRQILAIESGKVDLGIIRGNPKSPLVETQLWFTDSYSVIYNKEFVKLKAGLDLADLVNETFIFYNRDYAPQYYETLLQICAQYGFLPRVVHEGNNISSIIQLVQSGLGISIVPSSVRKNYNGDRLGVIPITKGNFHSEVYFASRRDEDSPIVKKAIQLLQE